MAQSFLRASGTGFLDPDGEPVLLRGVCLGGWLNRENVITGYAANETLMRREVGRVLGPDHAERFFDRLLTAFFGEDDAAFLAESAFNLLRIAVGHQHLEDDARPFLVKEDGFRHLDRAIETLARHGIYSIVDLHALPGGQNHHWHLDNPTHVPAFWEHPHFQDRVVNLWEAIAERYRDNRWVAGDNLLNEPADESRAVVGPFYRRLAAAIRAVDPHHTVFLDGNTYATEFDVFEEPFENAVYTLHDSVPAGLGRSSEYDPDAAEAKFLTRSAYARRTGTPILVGEFERLGVEQWGSDGEGLGEITRPVQELVAREAPHVDPYPWGRFDWVRTLLLNITLAQPLATEYAELFRGPDDDALDALADSFAFASCSVRQHLLEDLPAGLAAVAA